MPMIAKVALFAIDGRYYAIAVEQIDQIVPSPRIFPLPLMPPGIRGVFLHREEAVPMFDPPLELGHRSLSVPSRPPFAVVLHSEAGRVGLPADEVRRIVGREQGTFEKRPEEGGGGRLFVCDGIPYTLPDMESLIATLPDRTHPDAPAEGIKED